MRFPLVLAVSLSLVAMFAAGPAVSHPHAWIDVSVEVLFDPGGRVAALRQTWLFDEFYTADALPKAERGKMDRLIDRILENLREYGYFTVVKSDGRSIPLGQPSARSAHLEGNRLSMTFTSPLSHPAEAVDTPLTYSIFDPFYYIEMLHAEKSDAIRLVDAPAGCSFRLIAPRPDPKAVAAAAAIDRTQSGGSTLGEQFSEKVEIQCLVRP